MADKNLEWMAMIAYARAAGAEGYEQVDRPLPRMASRSPDSPMNEILSIGHWTTNAAMIADVAKLGYLDGTVLDATYGIAGGFWKVWQPATLYTNDLYAPADFHDDYRALHWLDSSVDAVVLDAPYKLNGTPALGEQDDRFGTNTRTTRDEVMEDLRLGAIECYRVCRRHLLVKCMDQVEGGRMRWQTDMVTRAIEKLGGRKVDRFDIPRAGRAQPTTRKCPVCKGTGFNAATLTMCNVCQETGRLPIVQRTSHGKHSTLLVFAKPKAKENPSCGGPE